MYVVVVGIIWRGSRVGRCDVVVVIVIGLGIGVGLDLEWC